MFELNRLTDWHDIIMEGAERFCTCGWYGYQSEVDTDQTPFEEACPSCFANDLDSGLSGEPRWEVTPDDLAGIAHDMLAACLYINRVQSKYEAIFEINVAGSLCVRVRDYTHPVEDPFSDDTVVMGDFVGTKLDKRWELEKIRDYLFGLTELLTEINKETSND